MSRDGMAGLGSGAAAADREESTAGPIGGRRLTSGEVTLLRGVFHGALDYERMRVRKGSLLTIAAGGVTLDNVMNINPDYYAEDFAHAARELQGLLVHEAVHVWQFQRQVRGYRWLKAAWEHVRYGKGAYDYVLDRKRPLADYRFEQMGQIVQDYFLLAPEAPERATYEAVIYQSIPRA